MWNAGAGREPVNRRRRSRLSLTPSVEVGLRRDGGDAETGAGMDVVVGLALTDAVTGLSLDVRVRTLVRAWRQTDLVAPCVSLPGLSARGEAV